MTNTPTEEREVATDAGSSTPVSVAPAPVAPAPSTPFWQRPLVERFLVPLVLPIAVIVGLVAYVLNISRLFLSGHGHIPVMVGTAITLMILVGATLLSAGAPKLKQSAVTLVGAAFILLIMSSGWLVLGHSQPEKTGPTTLPSTLKTKQTISVTAGANSQLLFAPDQLTAKTGLASIKVSIAAPSHTFNLADPTTLFPGMSLTDVGKAQTAIVFFAKPGTYTFFCATPGHEAAGMKGTITVTGPPMTLTQALTADGNAATAAG